LISGNLENINSTRIVRAQVGTILF
jgi:hypothetical protein